MHSMVNSLAIRRRSPFGLAGALIAWSTPISD
jgi:hypothetical protein